MAVDVRQLRALVTVIDEGTFTDAGIALRTSQASISRAVADLERAVGARLLLRTTGGALPTVTGRRVADHARRVLAEIDAIRHLTEQAARQLRVGFAWSIFGRHTTDIQRRWQSVHPDGTLTFVQSESSTAGLLEGDADIAVLRRAPHDDRFETCLVGAEPRMAALAADDPLARRRVLRLADLAPRTVAISTTTGTTTTDLWAGAERPTTREIHGIEEWLTMVASGETVGVTSDATATQFPRPGIRYRPIRDSPPIAVWLAWWRDSPPGGAAEFKNLVCESYATG